MNRSEIRRRIFNLGLPASLETTFQSFLGATDLLFVSHLGSAAVGAVGLTNTMMTLLLLCLGTFGSGGTVLVAQYFGKGDHDQISKYVGQIFQLGILISTFIGIGLVINSNTLLLQFGADAETAAIGVIYLSVVGGALPIAIVSVLGGEVLRAIGEASIPLYIASFALVLNTGLNALFIFGVGPFPSLGVAGVAYATCLTRIIAAIVLIWYIFLLRKPLRFRLTDVFHFNPKLTVEIFRIAWPVTVGESIWSASSFLYVLMFTNIGQQALVASQLLSTINNTIVMFAFGLSIAGIALVGQALGGERFDEAHCIANQILLITLRLSMVGVLLLICLLPFTNTLYPNIEQTAQDLIKLGLIVFALTTPLSMLNMVLGNGILRSGGDTFFILCTDIITAAVIGVPTAYLLGISLKFGFLGVILGRVAEEVSRILLFHRRFLSKRWARVLTESKSV
ncbi:MAG: MATE family efflux transporter [Tolypothrix carrinoi HA7290-LM1]|jgi:putative MATE family efflux protein|nr:MATE family efflux transporter [Tolypothrix carrinoi HA7290-LM1]